MKRLLLMFLIVFAVGNANAQTPFEEFRQRLMSSGFTAEDLAVLQKGDASVRIGKSERKDEVSIFGAIRIGDDQSFSLDLFRQSLGQRSNKNLSAGAEFSVPPSISDLGNLKLDDKDLAEFRKCRPARCDFNFSNDDIREIASVFGDDESGTVESAEELMRKIMFRYVTEYLQSGDRSLKPYSNRPVGLDVARAHREILAEMPFLNDLSPKLTAYFRGFPVATMDGATSEIRWSAIDFGLNPAIVLTHTVAVTDSGNHFVVNKQFYGSRYLDASLSMTVLLRVAEGDRSVAYVVFADRTRTDALGGPLGSVARKIVVSDAADRSKALLERSKIQLLAANRTLPADPEAAASDQTWIYLGIAGAAIALTLILFFFRRTH